MKTAVRRSPVLALLYGAPIGLLGGLIGLGGAEFRLPVLVGMFGHPARRSQPPEGRDLQGDSRDRRQRTRRQRARPITHHHGQPAQDLDLHGGELARNSAAIRKGSGSSDPGPLIPRKHAPPSVPACSLPRVISGQCLVLNRGIEQRRPKLIARHVSSHHTALHRVSIAQSLEHEESNSGTSGDA